MKKVLILSASTGGGHNRAAKAIQTELLNKNIECEIVDSLKFVSPTMDKIISKGYEKSAMYTPKAYGTIYKISDLKITKNDIKSNLILSYMIKKLKKLIFQKKPDAIIGTHPFPLMAVSNLKKNDIIDIPTISILTDYTIHSTWIQNEIDCYVVGDEFVKYLLMEEGIDKSKIYPYGIPIEKSFLTDNKEEIRKELNLDNKFTILLMGGSFGAGNIREAFLDLLEIDKDFQIIVVTGRNISLKEKIEKTLNNYKTNKKVAVLPFTNKMNDILSICDILITKPGGLTTTEALLKEVPMIIPYYIPGQEEENLDFLLNSGVALKTSEKCDLKILVRLLIENPTRLNALKSNIKIIKKLNSAENISNLVELKLNEIKSLC
ncbi:MGDG synthase family glycosyltransferase [Tepidibacter formicigenes]|uniref:Processive 1,2-diacylglycerol beta-glucosyltransferase n=1 Tax=Tepidibacter formicigenes DSM 15518 TaxID=1123349 RepID=A0A1M6QAF3_9FIRM|nr:glycosyltransferase [Tepidibacter formicigenes]SHK17073.1 processive 1,2-diacylglycerol beta-glucosyltransferase [Tepidibacter formicigenes DSM 15518]